MQMQVQVQNRPQYNVCCGPTMRVCRWYPCCALKHEDDSLTAMHACWHDQGVAELQARGRHPEQQVLVASLGQQCGPPPCKA